MSVSRLLGPTLLLAALAASAPSAPPSPPEPSPTAESLLTRSSLEHERLGPATVRVKLEEVKGGKTVATGAQTVRRNDPEHYVTEFREGPMQIRLIANGKDLLMRNITRKTYRRGKNYKMDLAMPFSRIRDEIAKGLKDEKTLSLLSAATVTRSVVDRHPVWRLDWKEPVKLGALPVKWLAIGEKDGLMRQTLLEDVNASMRATVSYSIRKSPFPAATFDLTPPKGTRDLATP